MDYPTWSFEETQKAIEKIIEEMDLKNKKILDIGCGPAPASYIKRLAKNNQITAIDNRKEILESNQAECKKLGLKINFLRKDGLKSGFEDNCFDLVICSEVIEHLKEEDKLLKEIRRMLKPKGLLILSTPNKTGEHLSYACQFFSKGKIETCEHINLFSKKRLKKALEANAFEIKKSADTEFIEKKFSKAFLAAGIGRNIVILCEVVK